MDAILLIFICLAVGVALRYVPVFPANTHVVLNQFVIWISLPSLALYYIPKIEISTHLLYPLGIAWVGFLLSFAFFWLFAKIFNWSRKLTGCLILMGGLGNTSFIGFPIIEALYGKSGLQTAIIVDQPGSFMVMATLGIIVAALYSRGTPQPAEIARKIIFFPPFVAFFVSILFNICNLDFVDMIQPVFQKLGATVTPIALVAVGFQLQISGSHKHWKFLWLGLFFKLAIMPLFFFILYRLALGQESQIIDVSIMEAAMAPMITASVLASNYGLKPKLATMMLGVGIPLSFLTLSVWYFILGLSF